MLDKEVRKVRNYFYLVNGPEQQAKDRICRLIVRFFFFKMLFKIQMV